MNRKGKSDPAATRELYTRILEETSNKQTSAEANPAVAPQVQAGEYAGVELAAEPQAAKPLEEPAPPGDTKPTLAFTPSEPSASPVPKVSQKPLRRAVIGGVLGGMVLLATLVGHPKMM